MFWLHVLLRKLNFLLVIKTNFFIWKNDRFNIVLIQWRRVNWFGHRQWLVSQVKMWRVMMSQILFRVKTMVIYIFAHLLKWVNRISHRESAFDISIKVLRFFEVLRILILPNIGRVLIQSFSDISHIQLLLKVEWLHLVPIWRYKLTVLSCLVSLNRVLILIVIDIGILFIFQHWEKLVHRVWRLIFIFDWRVLKILLLNGDILLKICDLILVLNRHLRLLSH